MNYGGTATFKPRVGDKARADARIILEGVKGVISQASTNQSNNVIWQSMSNSGSNIETLLMPSFIGPNTPVFAGPLTVQIPAGDFKTQVQTLSSQPGMSYLNALTQRSDVNWQAIKLAHEQWNYSQQGLTPAGAALLSVAVAWATAGTGASLVDSVSGTSAVMANAAFSSLAAQASISLINNKGDVGKTLQDLSTSSTAKATLAAVLTAGVIDKLGNTSTMTDLSKSTGFSDKLTYNLINATGRAMTNTAINGGNLEDALKQALIGGLVDTAHGQAASVIKEQVADYLAHKLAHALAGCVAGAAAGGQCQDGAIGSAMGEVVAGMFENQRPGMFASATEKQTFNAKVLGYSKLVAGAISAYAGGNAQTAITTAETAVTNNFLTYNKNNSRASQWGSFKQELDSCKVTAGCDINGVYNRWTAISSDQQRQAMGSLDALFALNPSEASTAGQWFGQAVSSMYMDPRDVCSTSDNRCMNFVQSQQGQAAAVFRSGIAVAYANDLVDGGARTRSSLLEDPPASLKTVSSLSQQQAKNAELVALFDKSNPSNSITLGKSSYSALPPPDSNEIGTTKTFNTASLSDTALQKEVMDYAQQLAGGKALTQTTKSGVWNVELADGTNINVRNFSSSGVGRWTVDILKNPNLNSLSKKNEFEVKFK